MNERDGNKSPKNLRPEKINTCTRLPKKGVVTDEKDAIFLLAAE
jgi:hypothetical protein